MFIEVILGKHRFIAGDNFSFADLFHLGFAPLLARTEADVMTKETRPNVARWWNEVGETQGGWDQEHCESTRPCESIGIEVEGIV
ncbi:hypothetical protein C8R47DRAFT_303445 [Mycena vitilis]|nr:hypothetical protein C8R47DRAFT_303445 [Mycena vitilis]